MYLAQRAYRVVKLLRAFSKTPELYGTGHVEGLVAPESANNGVTSGTLVPLLVIGIPGGDIIAPSVRLDPSHP